MLIIIIIIITVLFITVLFITVLFNTIKLFVFPNDYVMLSKLETGGLAKSMEYWFI